MTHDERVAYCVSGAEDASCVGGETLVGRDSRLGGGVPGTRTIYYYHINSPQQPGTCTVGL